MNSLQTWGNFVRFSHTIFSVPFALAALLFVSQSHTVSGEQIALLLLCLVSARCFGMGFNRLVDLKFDRENARTKNRELVTGEVSYHGAVLFCVFAAGVFTLGAFLLSPLCGYLAFGVLALFALYSLSKRFTALCHIILGLSLGAAPAAVWFALSGDTGIVPWLFLFGVAFWVAGFDVLYSLLDHDFDIQHNLHSIPVSFGESTSVLIARTFHVFAAAILMYLGNVLQVSFPYYVGIVVFACLLVWQHYTVHKHNLRALEPRFFALSGWASFVFLLGSLAAVLI